MWNQALLPYPHVSFLAFRLFCTQLDITKGVVSVKTVFRSEPCVSIRKKPLQNKQKFSSLAPPTSVNRLIAKSRGVSVAWLLWLENFTNFPLTLCFHEQLRMATGLCRVRSEASSNTKLRWCGSQINPYKKVRSPKRLPLCIQFLTGQGHESA